MKVQLVTSNNIHFNSNNNTSRIGHGRSAPDSLSSVKPQFSALSSIFSCFAKLIRAFSSIFSRKKEVYKVPQLENVHFQFLPEEIETMRTQYWKLGPQKLNEVSPL